MTYNAQDSILRRHYEQHLSVGGAELAGTNEEGIRMAGAAATAGAAAGAVTAATSAHGSKAENDSGYDATATTDTTTASKSSGSFGFLKILIPVAILGLVAWAAMKFIGKDVEVPTADVNLPTMEMPEMPGLPDGMSDELGGAFSGATSALGGITDIDSAKAAIPALDGLTGVLDKVPETARGPLSDMLGNVTALIEKASAIPGVEAILAPILEKLKGFM